MATGHLHKSQSLIQAQCQTSVLLRLKKHETDRQTEKHDFRCCLKAPSLCLTADLVTAGVWSA